MIEVKICGVCRPADAAVAAAAGASYVGVVLSPGLRRSRTVADAASIYGASGARRVGVFVNAAPALVVATADRLGLDVVQLHGAEPPEDVSVVRAGGWRVWKAIRIGHAAQIAAAAAQYGGCADGLLLDGWSAGAEGGTGTSFDWHAAAAECRALPAGLQMVLAGGLRPENVGVAIRTLHPAVVDVSSGVEEAPGRKSAERVRAFVAAARAADARSSGSRMPDREPLQ